MDENPSSRIGDGHGAMVIEFVRDEELKKLRPSAQLQMLLQDEHTTKLTWGTEFTECLPEFEKLRGITDIQRAKSQRDNTAPASLVDGLSHACSTLHQDKVRITKERMTGRFRRHQNTSVYEMADHDFLAYAGRDALAVLLAACFMGPDKAGRGQTASLSDQAASTNHQKLKRTSTSPPRKQLLDTLDWEDTRANPVYSTTRHDDDLWYAAINFDILAKQGRGGLERFDKRTKTIQRDDANKKAAMDLVAAVALRRLCGEPDESPADECYDDEFDNDLSEGEQLAVGQQCNAKHRRAQ